MSNHNLMIEIGRYDQNPKVLIDGVDNLVHWINLKMKCSSSLFFAYLLTF